MLNSLAANRVKRDSLLLGIPNRFCLPGTRSKIPVNPSSGLAEIGSSLTSRFAAASFARRDGPAAGF